MRLLSIKERAMITCGFVVVIALAGAVGAATWKRRIEQRDHTATVATLESMRWPSDVRIVPAPGQPDGPWVLLYAVECPPPTGIYFWGPLSDARPQDGFRYVADAWGQPIRIRTPGQVHRCWDMWSAGPNGIDEDGRGDDIIIGEGAPRFVVLRR